MIPRPRGVLQAGEGRPLGEALKEARARKAADDLHAWMLGEQPPVEVIRKEFLAALFVPASGSETAYVCEGVVIDINEVAIRGAKAAEDEARKAAKGEKRNKAKADNKPEPINPEVAAEGFRKDVLRTAHDIAKGDATFAEKDEKLKAMGFESAGPGRDKSDAKYHHPKSGVTFYLKGARLSDGEVVKAHKPRGCELVHLTHEDHVANAKRKAEGKAALKAKRAQDRANAKHAQPKQKKNKKDEEKKQRGSR